MRIKKNEIFITKDFVAKNKRYIPSDEIECTGKQVERAKRKKNIISVTWTASDIFSAEAAIAKRLIMLLGKMTLGR